MTPRSAQKTSFSISEDALLNEMKKVLTGLEFSEKIKIVSALPLTVSGKLDKQRTKALLE